MKDEPVDTILTKEEQAALTPDAVLAILKEGNASFVEGEVTHRDHREQVRLAAGGQFPKAFILSCVDSRIPVEDVFDRGIGDVFVGRIAGNFVNVDLLGSMEFACKVSGAKLIVVLGHESCGAIKGAIDRVELGNLTALLQSLQPAVDAVQVDGPRSSKNDALVHHVAEENVRLNVAAIREKSPILRAMEEAGELRIVGAMYAMETGKVTFFE
jgi:carbonic anhydrase